MVKLLKLDYRLISSQIIIIICAVLFSFYLGIFREMPTFSVGLLFMMTLIFSTVPFNVSPYYKSCFYNMLPVSTTKRVLSRYCYLLVNIVLSTILSFTIIYCVSQRTYLNSAMTYYKIVFIVSILCFSLCSLQYVIYYKIETIRNQQFAIWFRLIPAFALMLFVNIFSDKTAYILTFSSYLIVILFCISILLLLICITLSIHINRHRKN